MLKPYMGYSQVAGAQEGAILIFAHTVREAKTIGYPAGNDLFLTDYIDFAVRLIKDDYNFCDADKKLLAVDKPHVIDNPTSCKHCELWGFQLDSFGVCESCRDNGD